MTVAILGIDLAKRIFQLHGIDEHGRAVVSKRAGFTHEIASVAQPAW